MRVMRAFLLAIGAPLLMAGAEGHHSGERSHEAHRHHGGRPAHGRPQRVSRDPNDWPQYNHDEQGSRFNSAEREATREHRRRSADRMAIRRGGPGQRDARGGRPARLCRGCGGCISRAHGRGRARLVHAARRQRAEQRSRDQPLRLCRHRARQLLRARCGRRADRLASTPQSAPHRFDSGLAAARPEQGDRPDHDGRGLRRS